MPKKRNPKGRSVNNKGRNKHDPQFLALPYTMLQSAAWRALSGPSVKVFLEIRTGYHGHNNGELSLSYQRAADLLGVSKSTVKRAFDELTEKGFIRLARQGQWYGRLAAEYITTDKSYKGDLPTNDWKNWRPPKVKR